MIYCFDCDGVICDTPGIDKRITPDYPNSVPKKENIEKINALYEAGHYILIYTGRGTRSGIDWRALTEKQFREWGLKYHELKFGKPHFDCFVDDHALNVREFEQGDNLEEDIYQFLKKKMEEYYDLHYLKIVNAAQSATMRIADKGQQELEIARAAKWMEGNKSE